MRPRARGLALCALAGLAAAWAFVLRRTFPRLLRRLQAAPPATGGGGGKPTGKRSFRSKHGSLYAAECVRYEDELCRYQDHAGNLLASIRAIAPVHPTTRVVDLGAGTGKLCRLLAPHVRSVVGLDRSAEMLAVARERSAQQHNITYDVADVRDLPLPDASADVVIAGWTISYLKSEIEEWNHSDGSSGGAWREAVGEAIAEAERILVPGGVMILLETRGTASEVRANRRPRVSGVCPTLRRCISQAPMRGGSWLYKLFREIGFAEDIVRTDYCFPSREVPARPRPARLITFT